MVEIEPVRRAIVVGHSRGLGAALHRALQERGWETVGLSRARSDDDQPFDLTDAATVADAAGRLRDQGPFDLICVCAGILHEPSVKPEKSLRDISAAGMMRTLAVNTVGPALVMKYFTPLLPREGRCVFAVLSARVGSISDNRLGGWYSYRASKAALNMLVRTLAIELARSRPESICVALHPGTVDTDLSKPFQKNVDASRLFSAERSAAYLLCVIDGLSSAQSGRCFAWDGSEIAP